MKNSVIIPNVFQCIFTDKYELGKVLKCFQNNMHMWITLQQNIVSIVHKLCLKSLINLSDFYQNMTVGYILATSKFFKLVIINTLFELECSTTSMRFKLIHVIIFSIKMLNNHCGLLDLTSVLFNKYQPPSYFYFNTITEHAVLVYPGILRTHNTRMFNGRRVNSYIQF